MKTSEILISTFVAAAAMSVPAFAETTNTEISLTESKRVNVTKSGSSFTIDGTTYTPSEEQTYTVNVGSTTQLHFDTGSFGDFPLDIILNGAGYDNGPSATNEEKASLRLHNGVAISGNITLAGTEDVRIWASATSTISGKISSAAGATSGLTLANAKETSAQNLLTLTGGMEIAGGLCVEAYSSTKYAQLKLSKANDAETAPVYSAASLSGAGSLTIDTGVKFTTQAITGFTGTLSGAGTLELKHTALQDQVNVNFSAFTGTLSLAGSTRFSFSNSAVLSSGMVIDVASGPQLFLSGYSSDKRLSDVTCDVTLAGTGYGSGTSGAALRLHLNSTLSGKMTLAGDATIYSSGSTHVAGYTNAITGGISAKDYALTIAGDGYETLNISGAVDVEVETLNITKKVSTGTDDTDKNNKFEFSGGGTNFTTTGKFEVGTLNMGSGAAAKFSVAGTIGSLTGAGSFTKDGAGTLTISDRNSSLFTGSVLISGGTLLAGAEYALGENSSVTIDGGQLQLGEGVVIMAGNISVVLSNAYLNPSVMILAEVDVSSNAAILGTVSATNDEKESIGGSVTVTADLAALDSIFSSAGQYDFQIIDAGTVNVTDGTLKLDDDLKSAFESRDWEWSFSNGVLTVNVPEPSAFGLLAGAGVLALAVARRRRRPCRGN